MIQRRKKKGAPDESVAESIANATNDRESTAPELPGEEEPVEISNQKAGVGDGKKPVDSALDDLNRLDTEKIPELKEAEVQIEELKEQNLRARAEVENIRKRTEVEITNARKFALEGFARELLSVKDSLELARSVDLDAGSGDSSIVAKVTEGLDLTVKQLETVFEHFLIEEVNPEAGVKLDPEQHQAMSIEETIQFEPNEISRVIQKGYRLHNRLLRPAMVIVAKAPEDLDSS